MKSLRSFVFRALVGIIGGAAFPMFFYGSDPRTILNGAVIGIAISFTISFFEYTVLHDRLRRMRFSVALLIRTFTHFLIITFYVVVGVVLYNYFLSGSSVSEVFRSPIFRTFVFGGALLSIVFYALTVSFLVNMIRQMSRMLGQNVLLNMVIGKYATPVEEERTFMFLDLDASTTIAERLGNVRYHELLDDYVYDITKPILECGGEIYQYVGDEVVVTWKEGIGKVSMASIDCFFLVSETMEKLAPRYVQKYGFVPGFKAGFHFGTVVTGQIGDVKKEIVFQGDVVNTASRIKETCSTLGAKILISRELLNQLPQQKTNYRALRVGSFLLKGKQHEVELFSVAKTVD